MRLMSEGKAIGCVVSTSVHRALCKRAAASSLTVGQMAEVLIRRGVDDEQDAPAQRHEDAHRADMQQLEQERDAARAEATKQSALADGYFEMANSLREQFDLLQAAASIKTIPAVIPPSDVNVHRDMVDRGRDEAPCSATEPLSPAFVKFCIGFRSVGNTPAAIARLMRCDIAHVKRALERKRT